jgi:hypothetical protein
MRGENRHPLVLSKHGSHICVTFVSIELSTFQDPSYDEAKDVECLRV